MTFDFREFVVHHSKVGCSTSATGQQRPIRTVDDESGLPPTADELVRRGERRRGPIAEMD